MIVNTVKKKLALRSGICVWVKGPMAKALNYPIAVSFLLELLLVHIY